MKLQDISLATRVIAGVIAIVAVCITTLMFAESSHLRDSYLSERRAHLENDLDANGLRMKEMVNNLRQDVLFLAHIPPITGIMRASLNHGYDALDSEPLAKWENRLLGIFSAFSNSHPDYYKIRYIALDRGGRVLGQVEKHHFKIDATLSDKSASLAKSDLYTAATKLKQDQVWLSKIELQTDASNTPVHTLLAATPVFTPGGKIFGIIVLSMNLNDLLKSAISDLPGIQTYLSKSDGQFLLHPDKQRAFKFEPGNQNIITVDFPLTTSMFRLQSVDYLPLQANTSNKDDSDSFIAAKRIHFDPSDPSRFLVLLYYLPQSVAAKQIIAIPTTALLDEFIVMLLFAAISAYVLRKMFSPLQIITAAADKIASGNHDILLPQIKSGEIGSLTRAINSMMAKLSQREILLQKSEADLLATLIAIPDVFFEVGIDGRFYSYHSPNTALLVPRPETLIGKFVSDVMSKEATKTMLAALQDANGCGFSFGKQIKLTRLAGNSWLELSIARKPTLPNEDLRFIVIARDITERKENEQKQLKLTEQIRQFNNEIVDLYEHAPCGYHSLDKDGVIQRINETELKWLGYSRDEIVGKKKLSDLLSPDSLMKFQALFRHFQKVGEVHDLELELFCKDGSILPVLVSATAIYDSDGNYITSRATLYNMSERKKMDLERFSYVKRLEEISRHLVASQENVRRRLSSELHDRTSPNLAAISINMNIIASSLSKDHATEIFERLEDTSALISDTSTSIREICADMRPPLLDYGGLVATLESYIQQFTRRTGIEVQFECVNHEQRYTQELESLLFRIVQEALTNCAKHAQATLVTVTFNSGEPPLSMSIVDNGVGFDSTRIGKVGAIGMGVLNMKEMAEVIGGKFSIESATGFGTRVVVENIF